MRPITSPVYQADDRRWIAMTPQADSRVPWFAGSVSIRSRLMGHILLTWQRPDSRSLQRQDYGDSGSGIEFAIQLKPAIVLFYDLLDKRQT